MFLKFLKTGYNAYLTKVGAFPRIRWWMASAWRGERGSTMPLKARALCSFVHRLKRSAGRVSSVARNGVMRLPSSRS